MSIRKKHDRIGRLPIGHALTLCLWRQMRLNVSAKVLPRHQQAMASSGSPCAESAAIRLSVSKKLSCPIAYLQELCRQTADWTGSCKLTILRGVLDSNLQWCRMNLWLLKVVLAAAALIAGLYFLWPLIELLLNAVVQLAIAAFAFFVGGLFAVQAYDGFRSGIEGTQPSASAKVDDPSAASNRIAGIKLGILALLLALGTFFGGGKNIGLVKSWSGGSGRRLRNLAGVASTGRSRPLCPYVRRVLDLPCGQKIRAVGNMGSYPVPA